MTYTPQTLREMPRDEAIAIFEHWLDTGEADEFARGKWITRNAGPFWRSAAYRLPVTYPTVDWSHVADWVNYIAFDADGRGFAYSDAPSKTNSYWRDGGAAISSIVIASLTRGTCDWRDSLISRPGVEGEK